MFERLRIGILIGASLLTLPGLAWAELNFLPDVPQLGFSRAEVEEHAQAEWERRVTDLQKRHLFGCLHQCQRIVRVFERVRRATDHVVAVGEVPTWHLMVSRDPKEAAWSLAGGRLCISEPFIESEHLTDDELAFVLAHEMGHVVLQHDNQSLTVARQMMPRNIRATPDDVYAMMDFSLGFVMQLEPEMRAEEFEADYAGVIIESIAGFDPHGAATFMQKLGAEETPGVRMVETHPEAAERLARIRAVIPSGLVLRTRFQNAAR